MKTMVRMLVVFVAMAIVSGCQQKQKANLLSVDFNKDQALRYKLVSERETELNFDPEGKLTKGNQGQIQKTNESLEIVASYKPVKVDESGYTTIEATFETVNVRRSSISGKEGSTSDAVSHLAGKSVQFTMTPAGSITDYTKLNELVKELGKEAFGGKSGGGIKDPDMIADFIALQYFMWDPISSIENPAMGVDVGDSWNSIVRAPMPWPSKTVLDAQYTLSKVDDANKIDTITAKYSKSKTAGPIDWPMPYTGSFQMRGVYGFLRGYDVQSVLGDGVIKYDAQKGKLLESKVQYQSLVRCEMPFAMGTESTTPKPNMKVGQKLTIQLLGSK